MLYTVTNGGLQNGRPTAIGSVSIPVDFGNTHIFTIANFTTETSPAYSDPENDPLAYIKILSLPPFGTLSVTGIIFQAITVGTIIQAATISSGNLLYTPSVQPEGYTAAFKFDAADTGSSSLSGLIGNVSMVLAAQVNGKPTTIGDNTISKNYSDSHVFTSAQFTTDTTPPYSDPEGDDPLSVKILTLPASGTIQFNGSDVIVNQVILISEIDLGYLVYQPDLLVKTVQSLTFNFSVSDVGSGSFTE